MSGLPRTVLGAIAALTAAAMVIVSCAAPPSGGPGGPGPGSGSRYVDEVFAATSTSSDVEYAVAPNLVTGAPQSLVLDRTEPTGDTLAGRPAIVWIHGGGFAGGDKSSLAAVAQLWARRGYVTLSINYRVDPGNRCQDVQDGNIADPVVLAAETARCSAAIVAAQHDAQAAVRWVRANAAPLRVDPNRIAVGGGSAGAITAVNVAQRSEDPGSVGGNLSYDSSVSAAVAMSGCQYSPEDIDSADAPLHLLASELDPLVPFDCVTETETLTRAAGVEVGTAYYYGEGTHALGLYSKYRTAVDALWTGFLIEHLAL
jgi:acetyl esterase/lipase